ncbi:MAG: tyrosine-protein phosphatase [Pirellulaceae bacterium]
MLPLTDTHCHLLAGLDDGPRTWDDALQMCRIAVDQGVGAVTALAHQNDQYPDVTPARIHDATRELAGLLRQHRIPLRVYPCAEVMVHPEIIDQWHRGELLSFADAGRYLLIELPHGLFLDLRDLVSEFCSLGVRPILAHPERQPELLHDDRMMDELVMRGCLIQASASSQTQDQQPEIVAGVRRWAERGIIHLIGSDGHSVRRRPPGIYGAYQRLVEWVGLVPADRICRANGIAVLEGLPLQVPRPQRPRGRPWWSRLRGVR